MTIPQVSDMADRILDGQERVHKASGGNASRGALKTFIIERLTGEQAAACR